MESINEALITCVKVCGGSKQVAAAMWPDLAPDNAQRKLLNALDENRAEKLSPSQAMFIFKLARNKGYHDGMAFVLADMGYAAPIPIDPRDEATELLRQIAEGQKLLASQMERFSSIQPRLKAAA
jgi:hypothetical protein